MVTCHQSEQWHTPEIGQLCLSEQYFIIIAVTDTAYGKIPPTNANWKSSRNSTPFEQSEIFPRRV